MAEALLLQLGDNSATLSAHELASWCAQHDIGGNKFFVRSAGKHWRSREAATMVGNESVASFHVPLDADACLIERCGSSAPRPRGNCPVQDVAQTSKNNVCIQERSEREQYRLRPNLKLAAPRQAVPHLALTGSSRLSAAVKETMWPGLRRVLVALDTKTSSKKVLPTRFCWDELPYWARQASRSALQDLMGHHDR